ncbi:hypothetical protein GCM10020227_63370 [Streptomyces flavovirens]
MWAPQSGRARPAVCFTGADAPPADPATGAWHGDLSDPGKGRDVSITRSAGNQEGAVTKKDDDIAKGDEVSWRSHGQEVPGKVTKKITDRTEAAGRTVDASKDDPQYEVESDRSGRSAVHKPGALHKKGDRS